MLIARDRQQRLEIGRRIKELRQKRGWTQPELARALRLSHPQSISNYERGVSDIPTWRLEQIAKVFNVPPAHFFIEEEQAAPEAAAPPQLAAMVEELKELRDAFQPLLDLAGQPELLLGAWERLADEVREHKRRLDHLEQMQGPPPAPTRHRQAAGTGKR